MRAGLTFDSHGCPCGFLGDSHRSCHCTPYQIQKYLSRISGPLLDRVDIHIEVPAVPLTELRRTPSGTTSAQMREDVEAARAVQAGRFGAKHGGEGGIRTLGPASGTTVFETAPINHSGTSPLDGQRRGRTTTL